MADDTALFEGMSALVDGFLFETDGSLTVTRTAGHYPHAWPEDIPLEGQPLRRLLAGVADGAARHAITTLIESRREIRRLRYAAGRGASHSGSQACEITVVPLMEGERFTGLRGMIVEAGAAPQRDIAREVRGDVLSSISHELRTPLNAIIGYAEIVKTEMLGPLGDERYKDYVGDIHASGRHLLQMVDDILGIAHLESESMELREGPVALEDAVRFCVKMYGPRFEAKDIAVSTMVGERAPTIWGDANAVRQMLLHLLSNAERFVDPGGAVSISINRSEAGGLMVTVADTGVGIDAEQLDFVLIPFIEDQPMVSRDHGGVGLGLPIAKALLELHGGHIDIHSRVGEGTQVSLVFPPERVFDPARRPALRVV